jgi:formylmethanofuran dehydrogenase subunit D
MLELKLKKSKTFTAKVLEICDNGDAIVELPPDLLEEAGWKEGDKLSIKEENGSIILSKLPD